MGDTISKPEVSRFVLSCVSRVSSEPCEYRDEDAIDSCVRWCWEARRDDDDVSVDVAVDAIFALIRRRTIAAELGRGAGGG